LGWLQEVKPPDQERRNALALLKSDGSQLNWEMIGLALSLKADLAIVPLQDILGLGGEGRMNRPGTVQGNWEWRFEKTDLTPSVAHRLLDLTKMNKRLP
jgi:4-alpha-glucanotransferase